MSVSGFSPMVEAIDMSAMGKMLDKGRGQALNLTLGEPDCPPPPTLLEALRQATAAQPSHRYSPSAGLPALREAIADYESQRRGCRIEPAQVMVTLGATEGLALSLLGLAGPGQEVLLPEVGFVLNTGLVSMAGARPVFYPLDHAAGYAPSVEAVAELIGPKTTVLLVNNPSNPTGACWPQETVRGLAELAADHHLALIADEVYDRIIFDDFHSFLAKGPTPGLVYLNSFSKLFAIPGWRLGWMVAETATIEALFKVHFHLVSCPPTPLQRALTETLAQLPSQWLDEALARYRHRRDLMVERLNAIPGFDCPLPGGAFFAYTRFDQPLSSVELTAKIADAGVLCTPGTAFGPGGEDFLRFSFAAASQTIMAAMDLVAEVVEGL